MGLIEILLGFFVENIILFSPVAGFLSEDVLLFLIVVASVNNVGFLHFLLIGLLGLFGILLHDILLYHLTNLNIITKLSRKFNLSKSSFASFINRFGGTNYLLPLVFSKFIYGVRTATVVLVSRREKRFKSFLKYNSIATLIWFFVMLPVGWLTGKGFSFLLKTTKNLERILAVAFIIVIVIYFVSKIFKREVREYNMVKN